MRRKHYIISFVVAMIIWLVILNIFIGLRSTNQSKKKKMSQSRQQWDNISDRIEKEMGKADAMINFLKEYLQGHKNETETAGRVGIVDKLDGADGDTVEAFPPNVGIENDIKLDIPQVVVPKDSSESETIIQHPESAIAILVFSCNRVTVSKCLDLLIHYRPNKDQFPIIVSQDCNHEPTAEVIRSYGDQVYHIRQPDQSDIWVPPKEKKFKGYFKISRHYGWALNQTFMVHGFNSVVIVEDDLEIAPDFYQYFIGSYPILKADPTLWCVSAWNDNGKEPLIDTNAPELLYRTDFFPGLGWMLLKSLWIELMQKWPKSYWDDWIREPEQRKGRACIRPEVSRTSTFGKIGVSNGLFFEKHLKYIHLNIHPVEFSKRNMTYLLKHNYDPSFRDFVYNSPVVGIHQLKSGQVTQNPVRILYNSRESFKRMSKLLGIMDDFKSGVPRTAYLGIVSLIYQNTRVFLAPEEPWKGYDVTW